MKKTNAVIKTFDFNNPNIDLLQESLISELNEIPIIVHKIYKGQSIYRCRKHTRNGSFYYFEKDISYRTDLSNITSIGRCNYIHSSKLYGSVSFATTEIDQPYITSIFETSELLRDNIDGYERYTIGMWKAKEDLQLLFINPLIEKTNLLADDQKKVFDNFWQSTNDDQKEFYRLIEKEFSKKVPSGEDYMYTISSIISEILLQNKSYNGIIYPSVQTDSKGLNVVLNPVTFDQYFNLYRSLVGDLYKFGDISLFNNNYICIDATKYPFSFEKINEPEHVNPSQIIDIYESKGISRQYIITKLIEQINRQ
jgi:hypothetical protein